MSTLVSIFNKVNDLKHIEFKAFFFYLARALQQNACILFNIIFRAEKGDNKL